MKRLFSLLLFLTALTLNAQQVDENAVVKDSTGNTYPAVIWKPLVEKGTIKLKPENPNDPNTAYLIVRVTEDEKSKKYKKMSRPRGSDYFKNGEVLSFDKITDIEGNAIDLINNKGRITVINFWFINCPPCRQEIPELNRLVAKYGNTDSTVRFVGIALDPKRNLEDFLQTLPFGYSIVEKGLYLAQKYGIQSFPTHVILDWDGKVYFHTTGLAPNTVYWIEKSIQELVEKKRDLAKN